MEIIKKKEFWIAVVWTLIASLCGKYVSKLPGFKIIGAMVIALLVGMLYQFVPAIIKSSGKGVGFISNKFLRLGIILLGFKLNLIVLANSGVKSIVLALFVVTFTIILTYVLCKAFGAHEELALLTSCGCGICGAAAVMGVSPQIKSKADDSVLAVAVVCIMGTVFTLILVGLREIMPLSDTQYAVLCGASLHEIAHAVAASGAAGEAAVEIALITKLSRVLLLAPVALLIGMYYQREHHIEGVKAKLPIPWFMLGFLITSVIGSFFLKDENVTKTLVDAAYILLGMAMAALGMNVNFKVIKEKGKSVFTAAAVSSTVLFVAVFIAAKFLF